MHNPYNSNRTHSRQSSGVPIPDFGIGFVVVSIKYCCIIIGLIYRNLKFEMRTLLNVVTFQKYRDLCIFKKSGDGNLNSVLRASVC